MLVTESSCSFSVSRCRYLHCTRAVQKVSDLWPGKIHLHAGRSATLIPFEVVSLWMNTLLPAVPPLFEAFLECLFANGVQRGRRVPYNVVSWLNQFESLSPAFSGGGTAKNRKEPCRESRESVEPQECCFLAKKVWISCEEWAGVLSWCSCHVSRTLSAWTDHQSEWNVPNQFVSPPPPQVLGR